MLSDNPYILLSIVNTKLRDMYSSLEELCNDLDEDFMGIVSTLKEVGYWYDREENQFKRG